MAWIPLLLATWIVVDLVIVAAMVTTARRARSRRLRAVDPPSPRQPRERFRLSAQR